MRVFTIVGTGWNERLRHKREDDGITQVELGRSFGIEGNPQGVVSRMEAGAWPKDSDWQQAIANYIGEDVVALRREANNRVAADDGLDGLRSLIDEMKASQVAMVEMFAQVRDGLAEVARAQSEIASTQKQIAGALQKLAGKRP